MVLIVSKTMREQILNHSRCGALVKQILLQIYKLIKAQKRFQMLLNFFKKSVLQYKSATLSFKEVILQVPAYQIETHQSENRSKTLIINQFTLKCLKKKTNKKSLIFDFLLLSQIILEGKLLQKFLKPSFKQIKNLLGLFVDRSQNCR